MEEFVRKRIDVFQEAGMNGVDSYLASFGPALEEFSRCWPLRHGTPRTKPNEQGRSNQSMALEDVWAPYAVSPEDALNVARREVKRWRLEKLTQLDTNAELDPPTASFVFAWDASHALVFAYDEALQLARAVGVNLMRKGFLDASRYLRGRGLARMDI